MEGDQLHLKLREMPNASLITKRPAAAIPESGARTTTPKDHLGAIGSPTVEHRDQPIMESPPDGKNKKARKRRG